MKNAQMIPSQTNTAPVPMCIAFELSNSKWKLMFSDGYKRRQKTIAAGDLCQFEQEVVNARHRFKLRGDITIYSRPGWFKVHFQFGIQLPALTPQPCPGVSVPGLHRP